MIFGACAVLRIHSFHGVELPQTELERLKNLSLDRGSRNLIKGYTFDCCQKITIVLHCLVDMDVRSLFSLISVLKPYFVALLKLGGMFFV